MFSRLIGLHFIFLASLGLSSSAAFAEQSLPHHRVVLAVTEANPHTWNEVFGNFHNIQRALGHDNVDIEMVVYADAIGMLRDDSLVANRVEEALADGVKIVACENTMKAQNIGHDNMLPDIGYVQAGIVELIQRQAEGWAYVRP